MLDINQKTPGKALFSLYSLKQLDRLAGDSTAAARADFDARVGDGQKLQIGLLLAGGFAVGVAHRIGADSLFPAEHAHAAHNVA